MSHLTPEAVETIAAGGARDAHLDGCDDCRRALKFAKGRRRLMAGMAPVTLTDMAFRRVEARLMEQVEEGLPTPGLGLRWLWWLMPTVAAVALVAFVAVRLTSEELPLEHVAVVRPVAPPVRVAEVAFHPLTVLRASADAQVRYEGAWLPLRAAQVVTRGAVVSGERVVLAPDSEVAWTFEVSGSASLGAQATVAVGAGRLAVRAGAEPVEVVAGGWRFVAQQSAFTVSRVAAEVVLEVTDGDVEVRDSATATRRISAPTRVRWADGTPLALGHVEGRAASPPLKGLKRPWALLDLSDLPDKTAISIDGDSYGKTPFSLMLDAGRHRVLIAPPGLPSREQWIDLVGGQPSLLRYVRPATAAPELEPDREALAMVMSDLRRQTPKLQACYEKWLKANPNAGGQVALALSVSAKGAVREAAVRGDPMSAQSAECLVRTAKTLVLPPLGVDAELELPLVFTPKNQ